MYLRTAVLLLIFFMQIFHSKVGHCQEKGDGKMATGKNIVAGRGSDLVICVLEGGQLAIEMAGRICMYGEVLFEGTSKGYRSFSLGKSPNGNSVLTYEHGMEGVNYRAGRVVVDVCPKGEGIEFDIVCQMGAPFKTPPQGKGTDAVGSFPKFAYEKIDPPPAGIKFSIPREAAKDRKVFLVGKSAGLVISKVLEEFSPNEEITKLSEVKLIGLYEKTIEWDLNEAMCSVFGPEFDGSLLKSWSLVVLGQLHCLDVKEGQQSKFKFVMRAL